MQHGGQSRTRVLHIKIQFACQKRFVNQQGPAKIGFSLNFDSRFRFDLLRQQFCQQYLLREELAPNRDPGRPRLLTTRTTENSKGRHRQQYKSSVRPRPVSARFQPDSEPPLAPLLGRSSP